MKKLIIFICLCLLLSGCNGQTAIESADSYVLEESGQTNKNSFYALSISEKLIESAKDYFYLEYKNNLGFMLKYRPINMSTLCKLQKKLPKDLNDYQFAETYYADIPNTYGELAALKISFDSENNVTKYEKINSSHYFPCWEIVYEYIEDPNKIFGEGIRVDDIYCFSMGIYALGYSHMKNMLIYYQTDNGNYILYCPYEYDVIDPDIAEYEDPDNFVPLGYSDTLYLFPVDVLSQCNEYVQSHMVDGDVSIYLGGSQLHKIVNLEPYKFVPGQLPQ